MQVTALCRFRRHAGAARIKGGTAPPFHPFVLPVPAVPAGSLCLGTGCGRRRVHQFPTVPCRGTGWWLCGWSTLSGYGYSEGKVQAMPARLHHHDDDDFRAAVLRHVYDDIRKAANNTPLHPAADRDDPSVAAAEPDDE